MFASSLWPVLLAPRFDRLPLRRSVSCRTDGVACGAVEVARVPGDISVIGRSPSAVPHYVRQFVAPTDERLDIVILDWHRFALEPA